MMMWYTGLIGLICSISISGFAQSDEPLFIKKYFESKVPESMEVYSVPAVSIAVVDRNGLVWSEAWGVKRAGGNEAVDEMTIFEAASMGKALFAYAVLKLVETGKISLEDKLVDLDRGGVENTSDYGHITTRMVLNHSTGLPNWRNSGEPLTLASKNGDVFTYSGEAFFLLQRVITTFLDQPIDRFIEDALFKPLSMTRSSYYFRPDMKDNYADGHDYDGTLIDRREMFHRTNVAYSLYTTPTEFGKYISELMLLERSEGQDLRSDTIELMFGEEVLVSKEKRRWRGLGWVVERTEIGKRVSHSGTNGTGFRSYSRFYPAIGTGIVIMTNGLGGARLRLSLLEGLDP